MVFDSSLSVFFPAYNEEANLEKTVKEALEVLKKLKLKEYEVLIIDDGSKDRTGQIADEIARRNEEVKVIHQPNGGYGEAIKAGLKNSKYSWIFFTDSDGQFDFSEINLFLEKSTSADLIIGYRIDRQDPWMRKLNGWGWTLLGNLLFDLGVKDVDCAFKLIKKEVIDNILPLESKRGAMISPEILAKAKKKGYKIIQIGVSHFPRLEGNPTGASLNVIIQSFKDMFSLWWKLR